MKRIYLLLLLILVGLQSALAYDFSAVNEDGVTIYYNRTSDGCAVTYNTTSYNSYNGSVRIPSKARGYKVVAIGDKAFFKCSGLTSISIPNTITTIGESAFYGCSGLTSISIPNTITTIGEFAFYGCSGLISMSIPNSVASIGRCAFGNCMGLTSVTIPESVTSIGDQVFLCCYGLTSVTIPESVTSIGREAFRGCSGLTSVVIPNSVTSIGSLAFDGCRSLTSVTIPNTVTSIGKSTFEHCIGLTSVTIPNSVTSIGDCAFQECSSLTSVTIPESVTSIGREAFRGCSGLTSVVIPNSVTSIGSCAFQECSSLTSVIIPNSVTSIGSCAFQECSSLTSVIIPNSVTSIGSRAFQECSSLTSVIIPNSVTSIGWATFKSCSSLISVTIPESVTIIVVNAFDNCTSLKNILCLANEVPSCDSDVFSTSIYSTCTLSVPKTALTSYQASVPWSNFRNIQAIRIGYEMSLNCENLELYVGDQYRLSVSYSPETPDSPTITWTSSDTSVVAVSNDGTVTAVGSGTAIITASDGENSATCSITATTVEAESILLDAETLELREGESVKLVATVLPANTTDKTGSWTSSDETVATVDNGGNVTAVKVGTAVITATCGTAYTSCNVTVLPVLAERISLDSETLELREGEAATLVATVLPENTTDKTVSWTSSDETVATVDDEGNVTAVKVGTAVITATCGAASASCNVTVLPVIAESISLDSETLELREGESATLVATVLPANTTDKTVSWTSSDETVATVDNAGNVTAVKVGTAVITATCGAASASCNVTVLPVLAENISLDSESLELREGESATLVATVLPENTTDKTVNWTSSDETVATVDDEGNVIAVKVGTAVITATCGEQSASCTVAVSINTTESRIYCQDTSVRKFQINRVPVYLDNDEPFTAFSCDIRLPEGMIPDNEDNCIEPGERCTDTHIFTTAYNNGILHVECHSDLNATFGCDGALFCLPLRVDDNAVEGSMLTITFANSLLTADNMLVKEAPETSAQFTIAEMVRGDVNNDGEYNSTDISLIVDYVLGLVPADSYGAAADVNGDGRLSSTDISIIVSYVLGNRMPQSGNSTK